VLFRKVYDPVQGKEQYVKLNPKQLLREVYPRIRVPGRGFVLSIPDIYIKVPYKTLTRKEKPITRQRLLPIAAIAATYKKQAVEGSVILPEEECPATFKDAYLLIRIGWMRPKKRLRHMPRDGISKYFIAQSNRIWD
jgi:hypothetical protein